MTCYLATLPGKFRPRASEPKGQHSNNWTQYVKQTTELRKLLLLLLLPVAVVVAVFISIHRTRNHAHTQAHQRSSREKGQAARAQEHKARSTNKKKTNLRQTVTGSLAVALVCPAILALEAAP